MSADISNQVKAMISSFPATKRTSPNILLTTGPTYEDIDDVRFLGNRSSGKMGIAIARALQERSCGLIVITGPVSETLPAEVNAIRVRSALDMLAAVEAAVEWSDIIFMAAAVADYRPAERISGKITKSNDKLNISLVRNPDILKSLKSYLSDKIVVGFSLDSSINLESARRKMIEKNMNFIVANSVRTFNSTHTDAVIVDNSSVCECSGTKDELAGTIINKSFDYYFKNLK
ncbi:MAG: phosphopantothenoylcysteine decarboxylase domain-containing protein [Planctomycetota bacterium]|jgi:phosphopantothenoylcysteine decarboxylase/phosphopantothenate--cysteine ligase